MPFTTMTQENPALRWRRVGNHISANDGWLYQARALYSVAPEILSFHSRRGTLSIVLGDDLEAASVTRFNRRYLVFRAKLADSFDPLSDAIRLRLPMYYGLARRCPYYLPTVFSLAQAKGVVALSG